MSTNSSTQLLLEPADNQRLANLCGPLNKHIEQLERSIGVEITNRGNTFKVNGEAKAIELAEQVIKALYENTNNDVLSSDSVHLFLREYGVDKILNEQETENVSVKTKRGIIRGRSPNQKHYLANIQKHDINFGIGPAGTGKTYLAVASAVAALESDRARRLVLVRPAVEAGERLGFLPGDLVQKVDPYLRPLYDALYEMLGFERVHKYIERNVIEIAPLAFMRGRSLNEAFIILDEAQNTTTEQMKMFLTRIGFGSTAVITGDITQIDLPSGKQSGLRHAIDILKEENEISFSYFQTRDVVRHPIVAKILDAYERHEKDNSK